MNQCGLTKKKKMKKVQELKPKKFSIFVATPCHSDVSLHYFQACLEFQKVCMKNDVLASFQVMKSSLVTQGRNLCVSSFMESSHTHMLFVDSDIEFQAQSVFKMVAADKGVISVPYPIKQLMWDKCWDRLNNGSIKNAKDLKFKGLYTYPMKVMNEKDIRIDQDGVIEVTHSPTGCMLIKREVIEKMIKAYPEKEIVQKTVVNGELIKRPFFIIFLILSLMSLLKLTWRRFAFCKRWRNIGGKCYALITDRISHVGEHQYRGCFADELIKVD